MKRHDLKTAGLYLAGCLLLAGAGYALSLVPDPVRDLEAQLVDLEDRVQELERRDPAPCERPDIWGAPCASCGEAINGPSSSCGEWWHQGAETTDMGDDR